MGLECISVNKDSIVFSKDSYSIFKKGIEGEAQYREQLLQVNSTGNQNKSSIYLKIENTNTGEISSIIINEDFIETATRELLQTYFLIKVQEAHYNFERENGKPYSYLNFSFSSNSISDVLQEIYTLIAPHVNKKVFEHTLFPCLLNKLGHFPSEIYYIVRQCAEDFGIPLSKDTECIAFSYQQLVFNKIQFDKFLITSLNKDSERELFQTYFVSYLIKHIPLKNFLNKNNGESIFIDPELVILAHNSVIQAQLKEKLRLELSEENIFSYLYLLNVDLDFSQSDRDLIVDNIFSSIFNELEPLPTDELIVDAKGCLFFNFKQFDRFFSSIKNGENDSLYQVALRELTQSFFLAQVAKENIRMDYLSNLHQLVYYFDILQSLLEKKVSSEELEHFLSHLPKKIPHYDELSIDFFEQTKRQLKIKDRSKCHIIYTDSILDFDAKQCKAYLEEDLTEDSCIQLSQAYFLIQCIKQFGHNFKIMTFFGTPFPIDEDFYDIVHYEKEIANKLLNFEGKYFLRALTHLKKDIYFEDKQELFIIDKILPYCFKQLSLQNSRQKREIIFFFGKTGIFQTDVYHEFMNKELDESVKRELVHVCFMNHYVKLFSDNLKKNGFIIHPSFYQIDSYLSDIHTALYGQFDEKDLAHYLDILEEFISFSTQERDIIFDLLSIELNVCENRVFMHNDIMVFQYKKTHLTQIDFDERVCKKLLAKPINETTIREFSQALFLYYCFKHLKTYIKNNEQEAVIFGGSFSQLAHYIDAIYEKLQGHIDDGQFDNAVAIITGKLYIKPIFHKMNRCVFYPIKEKLNLTVPEVFSHLL